MFGPVNAKQMRLGGHNRTLSQRSPWPTVVVAAHTLVVESQTSVP
jgi:hypothetical protein